MYFLYLYLLDFSLQNIFKTLAIFRDKNKKGVMCIHGPVDKNLAHIGSTDAEEYLLL